MRVRTPCVMILLTLLGGTLLGTVGCAHDPNHDINMEEAKKAAERIHPRPAKGTKMEPGHGG